MKNLLLPFLAIEVIFAACEKEEELTTTPITPTTTYDFSCKAAGDDFTDNSPVIVIDPSSNVFTLDAKNGENTIRFIIYNFSDRNIGEEISLNNLTDKAYVTKDGVEYTNNQSGKLIFTKKDAELSGTFYFTSKAVNFSSQSVTEGAFMDLTY